MPEAVAAPHSYRVKILTYVATFGPSMSDEQVKRMAIDGIRSGRDDWSAYAVEIEAIPNDLASGGR